VAVVTAAGGTISLLVGAVLLRLTLSGTYERYVRVGMAPWLVVAGVAVVLLGAATLVRALRTSHDGVHGHQHGVGVGWLLLAPITALLLVAPPTLGSYGVARGARVDVRAGAPVFARLQHRTTPVSMTLLEFSQRAFDHRGLSFNGDTVRLVGFVSGSKASGFDIARYQIACCAADAIPVVVHVVGTAGAAPGRDGWVAVTGRFRGGGSGEIPDVVATSVAAISTPEDPYE
jgi:uncharacterized repeat protein (TIGR03943 family)